MGDWIVLGAGYVGARVAERVRRANHTVVATRRSVAPVVDLADRATLEGIAWGGATVVCCAPPGADPAGEMRTLSRAARQSRRLVYLSATSVYAPGGGQWVDESWPLEPATDSGKRRLDAERALSHPSLAILRIAGIYGPDRGIADRLRAGTYRIVGDGSSHVSRVHVDDLVEIIVRAGEMLEVTGPINVADEDPAPIGEVADAIAESLGLPKPPRVPVESVSPDIAGMLTADRKIATPRLEELEIDLRYRSWRDSL